MKGIILAAGEGKRIRSLTKGCHKSLLPINSNDTFLSRMLHQLNEYEISKLVVVTGYASEEIEAVGGQLNAYTSRESTSYYAKDLKENKQKWEKLYWTPRNKPAGIGGKNPSDVIIEMSDGTFNGYSNKAGVGGYAGKDITPKFNTNIMAFYLSQLFICSRSLIVSVPAACLS